CIIVSGFYTVREAERGVVLRFGKIYDVTDPGLRWKIPGIDTVNVVDIEQVRALQSSGTMLTQDENVVIVEMDVQYRISDPVKYLYSTTDPDHTLLEATDSALRYVVGHTLMDDILTSGREMVRQNTRELLTSIIEPYNTGLSIVDMNFLPARAPDQVKAAFDDAISAQEDEQRFKREAEAYANEVLPKADGQVQRIRQEAEAYRSQVVLNAQGEVARFEKVLPEYEKAPGITRQRIYFETMQKVMEKSRKVIIDTPEGSSPVIYLPLPGQAEPSSPQGASGADETARALKEDAARKASEAQQAQSQTQGQGQQQAQRGYPPLNGTGYGSYGQRRN
ncbi:MAG: FtsH protease activity modulator HflK, partial [Succinivibrio sp.]